MQTDQISLPPFDLGSNYRKWLVIELLPEALEAGLVSEAVDGRLPRSIVNAGGLAEANIQIETHPKKNLIYIVC